MMPFIKCSVVVTILFTLMGCASVNRDHLSAADQDAVQRIEAVLNRPETVQGLFTQEGPDQQKGWGNYVYRPGYLLLNYVTPHGLRAEAQKTHLVISDAATRAVTRVGLARNPLGLLLRHPVRLGGPVKVTQIVQTPRALRISLAGAENPSQGLLTLDFQQDGRRLTLIDLIGTDARRNRLKVMMFEDAPQGGAGLMMGVAPN